MCSARSSSRKTQARPTLAPGIFPALARDRNSCGWQRRKAAASLRSRVFTEASQQRSRWDSHHADRPAATRVKGHLTAGNSEPIGAQCSEDGAQYSSIEDPPGRWAATARYGEFLESPVTCNERIQPACAGSARPHPPASDAATCVSTCACHAVSNSIGRSNLRMDEVA